MGEALFNIYSIFWVLLPITVYFIMRKTKGNKSKVVFYILSFLSIFMNTIPKLVWFKMHECGEMGTFFCYCLSVLIFGMFLYLPLNIIIPFVFTIVSIVKKRKKEKFRKY